MKKLYSFFFPVAIYQTGKTPEYCEGSRIIAKINSDISKAETEMISDIFINLRRLNIPCLSFNKVQELFTFAPSPSFTPPSYY